MSSLLQKLLESDIGTRFLTFALEHRQRFFITLICIFIVYVFLCLLSYNSADPAWSHINTGTEQTVTNIGGMGGAWLADVLHLFFGKMAWFALVWLSIEAYFYLLPNRYALPLRLMSYGFLWVCICTLCFGLATAFEWNAPLLAGVVGQSVFTALASLLTKTGAYIFASLCLFGVGFLVVSPLYQGRGYFSDFLTKLPKKTKLNAESILTPTPKSMPVPVPTRRYPTKSHEFDEVLDNFLVNSGLQEELKEEDTQAKPTNSVKQAVPSHVKPQETSVSRAIINRATMPSVDDNKKEEVAQTAFAGVDLARVRHEEDMAQNAHDIKPKPSIQKPMTPPPPVQKSVPPPVKEKIDDTVAFGGIRLQGIRAVMIPATAPMGLSSITLGSNPKIFPSELVAPAPVQVQPAPVAQEPKPIIAPAPVQVQPAPVAQEPKPIIAPAPVQVQPAPVAQEPKPIIAPAPVQVQPAPVAQEPKPIIAPAPVQVQPAPVAQEPKPIIAPAPVQVQPAPVAQEPKPIIAPAPVQVQPAPVAQEPKPIIAPAPVQVQPAPVAQEPKPIIAPAPVQVQPAPVAQEPKPIIAPAPVQVQPAPVAQEPKPIIAPAPVQVQPAPVAQEPKPIIAPAPVQVQPAPVAQEPKPIIAPAPVQVQPAPVAQEPKPIIAPAPVQVQPAPVAQEPKPNQQGDLFAHQSFAMSVAKRRESLSTLPSLDLLDERPIHGEGYTESELVQLSELLEIKLREFGVSAEVMGISQGPVITSFEVALAAGIKASKVTGISQDLARSLSVGSVRVVEVIAGKPYIGIEIPNKARQTIRLIELLDTPEYQRSKGHITAAIGKSSIGEVVVTDLYTAPHMLIAGATRSGKSVLVNSMLLSLLLKYTPEELRFVMIDPKLLELTIYDDIPHLLTPVITDMNDSMSALSWCINEMNRRYAVMNSIKVRQISDFNKKVRDAEARGEPLLDKTWQPNDSVSQTTPPPLKPMPYIVVVVDEYADLVSQVKQVAELIDALARKSRAAGIHIILATQRPSVDVITGIIKANIPARIALSVRQKVDSRTILDMAGAETLLGNGDMLFIGNNSNDPIRVHGAYVTDEEVDRVCEAWRERGTPDYIELESANNFESMAVQGEGFDELYPEAVAFILETGKTSISAVQRQLNIGYNRAAKIIDAMESQGVLSPPDHTNKRTILKNT